VLKQSLKSVTLSPSILSLCLPSQNMDLRGQRTFIARQLLDGFNYTVQRIIKAEPGDFNTVDLIYTLQIGSNGLMLVAFDAEFTVCSKDTNSVLNKLIQAMSDGSYEAFYNNHMKTDYDIRGYFSVNSTLPSTAPTKMPSIYGYKDPPRRTPQKSNLEGVFGGDMQSNCGNQYSSALVVVYGCN
jgi:hypothetical protein